jgi:Cu/Zn superoxide dismutase
MRLISVISLSTGVLMVATGIALAQQMTFVVHRISDKGLGEKLGTASVSESKGGVTFKIAVTGLPKGKRGFSRPREGRLRPCDERRQDDSRCSGRRAL